MLNRMLPLPLLGALLLPLAGSAQADYADDFRLLAYNVFLLPSLLKPTWGQESRARLIAAAPFMQGQDAVVLNELFDNPAASLLLDGLKPQYPHQTPVLGRSRSGWDATLGAYSDSTPEDGGVAIVSRWPIEERIQYVYAQGCGADYLSNKGFVYVRLNKNGQPYHVIGTHAQAEDTGCADKKGTAVRASQFEEMQAFISTKGIAPDQVVFIGGDFNVIKGSTEYADMLQRLQVRAPDSYAGAQYSFDTRRNGIASYQYPNLAPEYLDYVFVSRNHQQPSFWHNQALDTPSPRWSVSQLGAQYQFQDYSDHYPIAAFSRADVRTPTRAAKPQQNLYSEVVLQSTGNGKTLRTSATQANGWVTVTGNGGELESLFSLRNWYYPVSFCLRSGDYLEVESVRHKGALLTWWLGGGGGNYAYYPSAGNGSNQLRVVLPNDHGGCLKDGDEVSFLDRDTVSGRDYYLQRWPSGTWQDHLYLWANGPAGAERFKVKMLRPPVYDDWSALLRY
ncbi:MAG: sphingomyelin phosphodiesterase [Pseudomonas sp.]|uniref:sphingomyelin phosphodiesterase n=1 Tax=Pseudomonas sp. TaxID=306 RepID=UPI0033954FBE